ncbi:MAG: tetratricopeptide repeat protein [Pseudomonadota bacterium]
MLIRAFAIFCLSLALSGAAFAQFGKPKPTPKTSDEYFAERAMRDAARLTEGIAGRDIIRPVDGVDLERAEERLEQAFTIYERLCTDRALPQDQWARNCFALADMYRRGLATEQDYPVARQHYDAACLEGRHVESCIQQAYISQKGPDAEIDVEHARALYQHACDLNDPAGCAGLGNMMYAGIGGSRNRLEAAELLQDSCADGYQWACTRLSEYGLCGAWRMATTRQDGEVSELLLCDRLSQGRNIFD